MQQHADSREWISRREFFKVFTALGMSYSMFQGKAYGKSASLTEIEVLENPPADILTKKVKNSVHG